MKDFEKLCRRTLSSDEMVELHCAVGVSTEAGELLDAYKKHVFYGRELDARNVREEIGDMLWYLGVMCDEVGYSIDKAQEDVIVKLSKRYPDGFKDVIDRLQDEELSHIGKEE
jgi:NTP pyrophosphatase (non-canonical NTP hydrolase)